MNFFPQWYASGLNGPSLFGFVLLYTHKKIRHYKSQKVTKNHMQTCLESTRTIMSTQTQNKPHKQVMAYVCKLSEETNRCRIISANLTSLQYVHFKSLGLVTIFSIFLKLVSYAHQSCIYCKMKSFVIITNIFLFSLYVYKYICFNIPHNPSEIIIYYM